MLFKKKVKITFEWSSARGFFMVMANGRCVGWCSPKKEFWTVKATEFEILKAVVKSLKRRSFKSISLYPESNILSEPPAHLHRLK